MKGRRDTHSTGTRWDLREAVGCLMVYSEPDSCSQGAVRVSVLSLAGAGGRLPVYGGSGKLSRVGA
ncbi:unnamed protein product, partial [Staurois parvus]